MPTRVATAVVSTPVLSLPGNGAKATPTLLLPTVTAVPTGMVPPTKELLARPTLVPTPPARGITHTLGFSRQGRPITSYQFNDGPHKIIFVGGMHGGYEWNTILLAYRAIDYFLAHPTDVPTTVTLLLIPSANPDGQFLVTNKNGRFTADDIAADTTPGRFNAWEVDLNRNWDCDWSAAAFWGDQEVSGGPNPFSEPETAALAEFLLAQKPAAVLFWHSAADGVFASGCGETFAPALDLATLYGAASGYPVYEHFTSYTITGDAGDWLAIQGIPAISVELKTHEDLDWEENLAGMLAILAGYDAPPK